MLLEKVGHCVLHGAMNLADKKALVDSALASRLSLSSSWVPKAHVPTDAVPGSEN